MKRWFVFIVMLSALAGCSSGPGPELPDEPDRVTSTATLTAGPTEPAILTTNTMHLLDAPHMSSDAPTNVTPFERELAMGVPLEVRYIPPAVWSMPRPPLAALRVHMVLWVSVEGPVFSPYNTPTNPGCFWQFFLAIELDGQNQAGSSYCGPEPNVVPTGIRKLEFDLPELSLASVQGDTLSLGFHFLQGGAGPGGHVYLLSGAVDADSNVTIDELKVPLGTTTLL